MEILEKYHPSKIGLADQADLISVIVAAYNTPEYIERGINSVRYQTYQNLEIIVVDDGSTDDTGERCDRIASKDARVRVIHKKNGGLAASRNTGMAAARGRFIAFIDGDDWIDPDMYERMIGAIKEQGANAAICRYRQVHKTYIDDQSVDSAVLFEGQEALQYYVQETKEFSIQNAAWNKLYRRDVLEGLSFPTGGWYEDILFTTWALSRTGRCIYLDTAYYNYIIDREGSYMNARINEHTLADQVPAYYEKTKFLKELGREDLADIHDYFFFKRLLLFYEGAYRMKTADGKRYMQEFARMIEDNKQHYERVYGCAVAVPRDYRKMKLFLRSPLFYIWQANLDERVVIPLKVMVKKVLKKWKSDGK